ARAQASRKAGGPRQRLRLGRSAQRAAARGPQALSGRLQGISGPGRGVTEGALEARVDLVAARSVVLRAALRDLDRAHHRRELAGVGPAPAAGDAVEESGAIRVAAAGGIDHLLRLRYRNLVAFAAGEDKRALSAERDHQRFHAARQLFELAPCFLLEHL